MLHKSKLQLDSSKLLGFKQLKGKHAKLSRAQMAAQGSKVGAGKIIPLPPVNQ